MVPIQVYMYMNVSVTTLLGLEEHNEDNFMWCLYFVYMISICFVITIIFFFKNFLFGTLFYLLYSEFNFSSISNRLAQIV